MKRMYQRKIVLLGDPGVGKTSLVQRYIYDTFKSSYMTTLGLNFYVRTFEYPNLEIKLTIWDIAGQESRRQIGLRYLKGASGALLAYDLSSANTFKSLPGWYSDLKKANEQQDIPVVLVGTKLDLIKSRNLPSVYNSEILANTPLVNANIIFTSSKTDTNVDAAFNMLVRDLVQKVAPIPDIAPDIKESSNTKILFFVKKDDEWSDVALRHIENLGKKYTLEVETIDGEEDPKIAQAYGISTYPTVIVKERYLVGIIQISHLENIIKHTLNQKN
ncbi:MAG: GTP-binding protein [Asgard group archaeon]|nr:GTP-binding protein [Asgard group archaeon]